MGQIPERLCGRLYRNQAENKKFDRLTYNIGDFCIVAGSILWVAGNTVKSGKSRKNKQKNLKIK